MVTVDTAVVWYLMLWVLACFDLSAGLTLTCGGNCNCSQTLISGCTDVTEFPERFANSSSITTIDLRGNKLEVLNKSLSSFEKLENLDVSDNRIRIIEKGAFGGLYNLKEVSLRNNRIQYVRAGTFTDLPSLGRLNLYGNDLTVLDTDVFKNMSMLNYLELSNNKIELIDDESFGLLPSLVYLGLQNNRLIIVPSVTFKYMPSLSRLMLSGNLITNLKAYAFTNCGSLRSLHLNSNTIGTISDKAFLINGTDKALKITGLLLNDNQITSFPPAVRRLNRLQLLMLSNNNIVSIPSSAMDGLQGLSDFQMSNNPELTLIQPQAFQNLKYLRTVYLNHNKGLTHLPDKLFSEQTVLHTLFISNTSIATFQETLVDWKSLIAVDLTNNPFLCDCNLKWMSNPDSWSDPNGRKMSQKLFCASPPNLLQKRVVDLDSEDLNCVDHHNVPNRLLNGIIFSVVALVFVIICGLLLKYRRSVMLRWRYYRYARQTDEAPFTVDNEYSDYPTGDGKLRMSDLERET